MITPSHIIYGYRFACLPDDVKDEEDEEDVYKIHRYIANKRRNYWKRWQREYLVSLREHYVKNQKKASQLIKNR